MSVLTVMIMMTTTIIRTVAVAVRKGGYKETSNEVEALRRGCRGGDADQEAPKRRRQGGEGLMRRRQ